ncbi:MAG: hypothetical protein HOO06_07290 [Bdellovibrionaceae bacterium]|jgi:hypothetical protein|nr:hypothetical protein [Pseudobdellovibrionaceae bacterium]
MLKNTPLLIFIILCSVDSFAMQSTSYFTRSATKVHKSSCPVIFNPEQPIYYNEVPSNFGEPIITALTLNEAKKLYNGYAKNTFNNWGAQWNYSHELLTRLSGIEAELSIVRIQYVYHHIMGEKASIRLYDGSITPHKNSALDDQLHELLELINLTRNAPEKIAEKFDKEIEDRKIPIERKYKKYQLRHRLDPELSNRGIIELGLLSVDKTLLGGLDAIFRSVANLLDYNYNNSQYYKYGQLSTLGQNTFSNPVIYVLAQKSNGKLYQRYGFEPDYLLLNGEKVHELPDNMQVYTMSAARFIQRLANVRPQPKLRTDKNDTWTKEVDKVQSERRINWNLWIHHKEAVLKYNNGLLDTFLERSVREIGDYNNFVYRLAEYENKLGKEAFIDYLSSSQKPLIHLYRLEQAADSL